MTELSLPVDEGRRDDENDDNRAEHDRYDGVNR